MAEKNVVNQIKKATRKRLPAKLGDHYSPSSYRAAIQRACRKAGIPIWYPHRLWHNAATCIGKYGICCTTLLSQTARIIVTTDDKDDAKDSMVRFLLYNNEYEQGDRPFLY